MIAGLKTYYSISILLLDVSKYDYVMNRTRDTEKMVSKMDNIQAYLFFQSRDLFYTEI